MSSFETKPIVIKLTSNTNLKIKKNSSKEIQRKKQIQRYASNKENKCFIGYFSIFTVHFVKSFRKFVFIFKFSLIK